MLIIIHSLLSACQFTECLFSPLYCVPLGNVETKGGDFTFKELKEPLEGMLHFSLVKLRWSSST